MNSLNTWMPDGITQALGTALFHSLWQAAAAGLILFLLILAIPRKFPQTRYLVGVLSIIAMVAMPAYTFIHAYSNAEPGFVVSTETTPNMSDLTAGMSGLDLIQQEVEASVTDRIGQWFDAHQSMLVLFWMAGMTFFIIRFSGGYLLTLRLRNRGLQSAPREWQQRLDQMAMRMRVGQPVRLFTSQRVTVPMVMGFLKPMILFPAGMLADLTPDQVELILAHELAHVRRHDYAVNMLLSVAQMLLFFHPAMWLAARFVREERENCCDAVALRYHPDPAGYARTLLALETYRQRGLMLSARGGSLRERIARILNMKGRPNPVHYATAAILGLALVVSVMASSYRDTPLMKAILGEEESTPNVTLEDVVITASMDEEPQEEYAYVAVDSEEVVINILRDGKRTEIRLRDGVVVSVTEDGQAVPSEQFDEYREMALQAMANTRGPVPPPPGLPSMPPAPSMREGEDDEQFERRMEAWEEEMETWGDRMEVWGERQGKLLADSIKIFCEKDMKTLGDNMRQLEREIEIVVGDEAHWEEFAKNMERLAKTLARDLGENAEKIWTDDDAERFEKEMERFGKDMEKWGEDFGKRMEKLGEQESNRRKEVEIEVERKIEKRIDHDEDGASLPPAKSAVDQLSKELKQDGLISNPADFTLVITDKEMRVNGKKVDSDLHEEYRERVNQLYGGDNVTLTRKQGKTIITVD